MGVWDYSWWKHSQNPFEVNFMCLGHLEVETLGFPTFVWKFVDKPYEQANKK